MSVKREAEQTNPQQYALWLKPENEVYGVLKRIIDDIASEYNAPVFEPHITVAGSIDRSEAELKDLVTDLARESEPMTLHLKETDFRDSLYRALFVHIAPNDTLLSLRERCLTRLKKEHEPYMPHVSLMYKEMEADRKKEIIERVGERFDLVFIPDKLYLVRTDGGPEAWEEIMHVSLKS